jgi:endonuclease YncB( thermonuclease family)
MKISHHQRGKIQSLYFFSSIMKKVSLFPTKIGQTAAATFLFSVLLFILSVPAFPEDTGRVQKVYDGDTVLLEDGRKIRYLGINTPEWQEPFYLKAKKHNEALVLGKKVRLEFDVENTDKYGRLLAYVYVGDQMANAKLVEEGLADPFFIPPNSKHHAVLLGFQAEARKRKAGLWSKRGSMSVLKITTVSPARTAEGEQADAYLRILNIGAGKVNLSGYTLSSERETAFKFPAFELQPGYSVLVVIGNGRDGLNSRGQLIVYWKDQSAKWDESEDTAYLNAPDGTLIDSYHYKGRRVSRKSKK